MRHTIKRLLAIVTGISGVPLLMIARATDDVVIRSLAITAGVCLLLSGAGQFWLQRKHRRAISGDDVPY
jgi:hypothetical protein